MTVDRVSIARDESVGPRRAQSTGADAVTLLTVLIIVRLALPSQLVVGPLGGAGSPATLLGLCLLGYWLWHRLHRIRPEPAAAVNVVAAGFFAAAVASLVGVLLRPAASDEARLSVLSLLSVAGWLGGLFLASDGVASLTRLKVLIGRMAVIGGLFAAFGLIQFATARAWVDVLTIPGLEVNTPIYSINVREGFIRPFGTAIHPIEFGSVLGVMLPLTIVHALLHGARGWRLAVSWLPALLTLTAASLSSSRSAIIGVALGAVLLLPALNRVQRLAFAVGGAALALFIFVTVPGMVGSVLGLFGSGTGDPSVASRIDSFSVAADIIPRHPIFGRGLGTFLPSYRIFDNQYLLALVEIGLLGFAAMLLLWLVPAGGLVRLLATFSSASSGPLRLMAAGLLSSAVVGGVSMVFFDGFGFPMLPAVWFIVLGLAGACYRLAGRRTSW